MNCILAIHPYRNGSLWVFDDASKGLEQEPFVSGMPEIIEHIIGVEATRFTALFSAAPFPGYTDELVHLRDEYGGNWYRLLCSELEGWLCPALFHYFNEAPKRLHFQGKDIIHGRDRAKSGSISRITYPKAD